MCLRFQGAKRVSAGTTSNQISSTAFMNTDGSLVVVALNDTEEKVNYLSTVGNKSTNVDIPQHSIQIIVFKNSNK
ncbi:MAG: glycoside hydrolase family 30 beta sandwich domain-containing protein [Flavobacteriaceae bacterium]|nr:glycoside hydrolase family 30 beta sandwich domain-containing protein [Flavobacteriaceae bacterium]